MDIKSKCPFQLSSLLIGMFLLLYSLYTFDSILIWFIFIVIVIHHSSSSIRSLIAAAISILLFSWPLLSPYSCFETRLTKIYIAGRAIIYPAYLSRVELYNGFYTIARSTRIICSFEGNHIIRLSSLGRVIWVFYQHIVTKRSDKDPIQVWAIYVPR